MCGKPFLGSGGFQGDILEEFLGSGEIGLLVVLGRERVRRSGILFDLQLCRFLGGDDSVLISRLVSRILIVIGFIVETLSQCQGIVVERG